jgi:hypothetical protein
LAVPERGATKAARKEFAIFALPQKAGVANPPAFEIRDCDPDRKKVRRFERGLLRVPPDGVESHFKSIVPK